MNSENIDFNFSSRNPAQSMARDGCVQGKIPPVHLRIRQTSSPLLLADGSLLVIKGAGEGGLAQVDLFTLKVVLSSGE